MLTDPDTVRLTQAAAEHYGPGDTYSQRAEEIHDTIIPQDGTVTLVRRFFTRANRDEAQVFWREGPWVSAQPRDATDAEVADIVRNALEVWR